MPHREVKKNIDALREELSQVSGDTSELEEKLASAQASVESESQGPLKSLADSLRHETEAFEVEHPKITELVNQVMVSLSNYGI